MPGYQILQKIGRGGSGEVYLVRHQSTGQIRAAKQYHKGLQEEYIRELRAMRNLRHRSLPQIIDVINTNTENWLIMEYMPGKSLQELSTDTFSEEQLLDIAEQLADVLVFLHSRAPSILHLDIKPSNLILSTGGKLALIDFGAAVLMLNHKAENPCIGTPGYAAPEQADIHAYIDERADIYGFGAVMNWYLKKMNQWKGKQERTTSWKQKGIRKLIEKCIQDDPGLRYSDSRKMLQAVQREKRKLQKRKTIQYGVGASLLLGTLVMFSIQTWKMEDTDSSYEIQNQTEAENITLEAQQEYILRQSELFGMEAALGYYVQAAALRPINMKWCFHLLERIAEDDVFTVEEEAVWKELLLQITEEGVILDEILSGQQEYQEFAFQMGMNYWYCYDGNGGKSAAIRWFEKSLRPNDDMENEGLTVQEEPVWQEAAKLHIKLYSFYKEKTERINGEIEGEIYGAYWENLLELWKLESFATETLGVRMQIAEEIISGIIIYSAELKQAEINLEEIEQILLEIEQFIEQEQMADAFVELIMAAKASVKRNYKNETEKEVQDEKQKSEME